MYLNNFGGNTYQIKTEPRIITFRSFFNPQRKVIVTPYLDAMTNRYKGVAQLTEEEKRRLPYHVVPEKAKRVFENGSILDLSNPVDAVDWEWIQHSKGIAPSYEEGLKRIDALLYVYDPEAEYKQKEEITELRYKAMTHIRNTKEDEFKIKARILGNNLDKAPFKEIKTTFLNMAESSDISKIKQIIAIYEDPDAKYKYLILDSVDKGILKLVNNVYKFPELAIDLGIGIDQAIAFLKLPQNQAVYQTLVKNKYADAIDHGLINMNNFRNPTAPSADMAAIAEQIAKMQKALEDQNRKNQELEALLAANIAKASTSSTVVENLTKEVPSYGSSEPSVESGLDSESPKQTKKK